MDVDPFSSCPKPGLISCLLGEPWYCVVVYPTCVSQRRWILSTFPWVKSDLSKLIMVSHFPLPRIWLGKGIWQNSAQGNMRGNFLCASEKSFFIERNRHIRKGMSLLPWSYHIWMWCLQCGSHLATSLKRKPIPRIRHSKNNGGEAEPNLPSCAWGAQSPHFLLCGNKTLMV